MLEKYGYRNQVDNPLIENVKNYLQTNLEYDIDLSHITTLFHYNRQYLGRLFKKETGLSIRAYVMQQRLERAKALLNAGYGPVGVIAEKVGFRDAKNFATAFKKAFGYPPSRQNYGKLLEHDLTWSGFD